MNVPAYGTLFQRFTDCNVYCCQLGSVNGVHTVWVDLIIVLEAMYGYVGFCPRYVYSCSYCGKDGLALSAAGNDTAICVYEGFPVVSEGVLAGGSAPVLSLLVAVLLVAHPLLLCPFSSVLPHLVIWEPAWCPRAFCLLTPQPC